MKVLVLIVLAVLACVAVADETDEDKPKLINKDIGLTIEHCHLGDSAIVHVIPVSGGKLSEGWFTTTNEILALTNQLSMVPNGTNRLEIRTICQGQTSEVSVVTINIQRPPPKPRIGRRLLHADTNVVYPPAPPGLTAALPHGTNSSYQQYLWRLEHGQRRNQ